MPGLAFEISVKSDVYIVASGVFPLGKNLEKTGEKTGVKPSFLVS